MTDDRSRGFEAANQGVGMPGGLSLAGQEAYNREIARRSEANMAGLMPKIGMPPAPSGSGGGLTFLLMLPVLAVWFVAMDLVRSWRWYRVVGLLLAVLFTAAVFAYSVYLGVQIELSGVLENAENDPTVNLLLDIGTVGLCAVIFTLFPRTIVVIAALGGLFTAYNAWIAPLW
jgi:hypothetical protein